MMHLGNGDMENGPGCTTVCSDGDAGADVV